MTFRLKGLTLEAACGVGAAGVQLRLYTWQPLCNNALLFRGLSDLEQRHDCCIVADPR